ncbi:UDP-4-amino-4,6-dideoxy-N-acetyl-beta-L-altrosamine N-acetyltransferase [Legionella israelensis]|nr:UDP-4-amino-4,6-dideoxy-N-acetyl-beta-L-altrosamine N-acetyltransferase [Legionella israelensis]
MTENDLLMVFNWRSHPDVRRFMYTNHEITFDEHLAWFEQESANKNRYLLIFENNNIPCGFVNFKLQDNNIADWGFYIAPDSPKGVGILLGKTALNYAFVKIKLHKIMGQVLQTNTKSLSFHQKLGFLQEGIFREQHYDGFKYNDVIYFGLLKKEWIKNRGAYHDE